MKLWIWQHRFGANVFSPCAQLLMHFAGSGALRGGEIVLLSDIGRKIVKLQFAGLKILYQLPFALANDTRRKTLRVLVVVRVMPVNGVALQIALAGEQWDKTFAVHVAMG